MAAMKATEFSKLWRDDGNFIVYHHTAAATKSEARPGLVFVGGFASDMTGTKACFLAEYAAARGISYTRFDSFGHGAASGRLEDGTIGHWSQDLLAILGEIATGPQILVGSSMGAWLSLLAMRAMPERIAGFIGVAAAPDFTERLLRPGLSAARLAELAANGVTYLPSGYDKPMPCSVVLLEEAKAHLVLTRALSFSGPVRLLHGMVDLDVPHQLSLDLVAAITSTDVRLTLIKDGDHRLSRPSDLGLLAAIIDEVYETLTRA